MSAVSTRGGDPPEPPGLGGSRHPSPPGEDDLPELGGIVLPSRPVLMAGGVAALAAASGGLAVLVTLTAIGWITAPHVGLGGGLSGVVRSAGLLWLVAHHVQVTVRGVGQIGLLPLGLLLLPGVLIERAGRWMTRAGYVTRLRHVAHVALAIAFPYALFAGAVAMASATPVVLPSLWQAVCGGFLLALIAGGLGAARGLAPWRQLVGLVPPRPRSVILGMAAALAVLTACGAVLAAASLAMHLTSYTRAMAALSPGIAGSALLLLAGLSYLPNSVIWAIAYILGPGFSFGLGTAVSPSGSALGAVPAFPMLAALPVGPRAAFPPWLGFFILALPYLAGALAGLMTVRIAPTPFLEAAPLWGLLTGSLTALVIGFGARLSGGPLGAGRLASVGPAGAEVGLVALLEVGVTAALVAGGANWLLLRRHIRRLGAAPAQRARESALAEHLDPGLNGTFAGTVPPSAPDQPHQARQPRISGPVPAFVVDETDDAGGHRIYYDPWAADREA